MASDTSRLVRSTVIALDTHDDAALADTLHHAIEIGEAATMLRMLCALVGVAAREPGKPVKASSLSDYVLANIDDVLGDA